MEIVLVPAIVGLFYLWPVLLSELHLYRVGKSSAIKLRLKVYGLSYGIWLIFGILYSLVLTQLNFDATQYASTCGVDENDCDQAYLMTVERIDEWGDFFLHPVAALCAWFVLQWRSKQI
ncbi:hypothetical protein [Marinobacter daepoensis]|uniref:hypothetical protein n=1 Tax=Marinobacter daepoensis TaxID=262077 RepID=UPI0004A4DC39|nr:hypothetical protein [Marinobacter daepoensis]